MDPVLVRRLADEAEYQAATLEKVARLDVLADSMRGRHTTWTRIRVNLRNVGQAECPPQEPRVVDTQHPATHAVQVLDEPAVEERVQSSATRMSWSSSIAWFLIQG